MITKAIYETITELYPNEKWRYSAETETLDLSNLKFENGFVPDEAKIKEKYDVKLAEIEADVIATQYQRDRRYPSVGDQLDMQYHDELDGTTTWKDAIAKVKSDNPKE